MIPQGVTPVDVAVATADLERCEYETRDPIEGTLG